ncbi:hypothetical protein Tco_1102642 [Tanacetum coccineum]
MCEVILQTHPSFNSFVLLWRFYLIHRKYLEWVEVWEDIPTLYLGFVLGGKNGVWLGRNISGCIVKPDSFCILFNLEMSNTAKYSGRTSNALSISAVVTNALTQSGLICSFWIKASATTFAFLGWCGRRCPILNCFNLGGVKVNSLTVNYVPEKLHDTDPEITFGKNLDLELNFKVSGLSGARSWELNLLTSTGELEEGRVASSGWPFVSAVPGLVTYLVASLTLDSARSCVMQGAFLTQGKASSIPTIFSWGDNISLDSFLPSIMLLLVIIVAVVIVVTVILVVVVGEAEDCEALVIEGQIPRAREASKIRDILDNTAQNTKHGKGKRQASSQQLNTYSLLS